jgi:hypothetical protein
LRWLITHNPPLLTCTSTYSIVFIHDLTENRDEAWKSKSSNDPWPKKLLPGKVAKARIFAFGYDPHQMTKLDDMLNPENLERCAKNLLAHYPLRRSSTPPSSTPQEDTEKQSGVVDIERPAVFVAHGFGGLVYEQVGSTTAAIFFANRLTQASQALVLSDEPNTEGKRRRHAALLLDTPHHGAGLAEWAILCAQHLKIPCADTAQKQDWSDFKPQLAKIDDMQRRFRCIIREKAKVNIAACYATRFVPDSKLVSTLAAI